MKSQLVSSIVRVASLVALTGLVAGCVSIPQRAWANGQAMSQSRAYQRAMAGDMSFSTHRDLQQAVNFGALGHFQEAPEFSPFPKFGFWK